MLGRYILPASFLNMLFCWMFTGPVSKKRLVAAWAHASRVHGRPVHLASLSPITSLQQQQNHRYYASTTRWSSPAIEYDDQGRRIRLRNSDNSWQSDGSDKATPDNHSSKDYKDNPYAYTGKRRSQDYGNSNRRNMDDDAWPTRPSSKESYNDSWGRDRNRSSTTKRRDGDRNRYGGREKGSFGGSQRQRRDDDFGKERRYDKGISRGRPARLQTRGRGVDYTSNRKRFDDDWRNRRGHDDEDRVDLRALEEAGFVHLYGITPVLNALKAGRREMTHPNVVNNKEWMEQYSEFPQQANSPFRPETKASPWLFIQESSGKLGGGGSTAGRSRDKRLQAEQISDLAKDRRVPIAYVDKGVLNTLSGNRPHQGFVLRCGTLSPEPMSRIPIEDSPPLWLVLDEVVDPQNLGALLRSAYFLWGNRIQIMICAKNSAPLSPVVSAASAGALESMTLYSTNNLPRTLTQAEEDGFRIVGASSSLPKDMMDRVVMHELGHDTFRPCSSDQPTLLVLGSEGHGLRNLVARACTEFVRIPGRMESDNDDSAVDSLNVSVTGGILLWHFVKDLMR